MPAVGSADGELSGREFGLCGRRHSGAQRIFLQGEIVGSMEQELGLVKKMRPGKEYGGLYRTPFLLTKEEVVARLCHAR